MKLLLFLKMILQFASVMSDFESSGDYDEDTAYPPCNTFQELFMNHAENVVWKCFHNRKDLQKMIHRCNNICDMLAKYGSCCFIEKTRHRRSVMEFDMKTFDN